MRVWSSPSDRRRSTRIRSTARVWSSMTGRTIFTAAVDDELIPKNPCKAASVRRPWPDPKKLVPWTREQVLAVRNELPERYHLVVWLGAGLWFAPGRDLRSLPRRHRLPGGRGSRPAAGQGVRRERSGLRTADGAQGSAARRR